MVGEMWGEEETPLPCTDPENCGPSTELSTIGRWRPLTLTEACCPRLCINGSSHSLHFQA